ncbi:PREDICTED: transcription initiation factor TFIID subunit 4-like [Rhagoletis zephyria]|uniref:transcription initiation factor TFIID subunit 4-like n=1 Tax=Rhagoletis zephyria TaxID=28612 RepID=UPI0008112DEE|nr:PREDICTED: transcription initiation factor TFIID subunit 4-like [Rhagoletis zephyria]
MAIGNGTAQAAAQAQQAAQVAAAQMGGPHGLTQLQHLSRGPQQMVRLITPQQGQTLAGMGGHPLGHGPQQIITSLAHGGNLAGTPIMLTSAMGGGGPAQLLTTVTTAQQHQLHQQQQQQQHQHLATSLGVGPPTQQPGGILSAATTLPQTRMPVPTMMQVGHPVHQMGAPLNALPINQCQLHPGAPTIPPPARATTPSKPKAPSKSKAAKEKAEAKKAAAAANAAALAAASAASSGGAGVPGVFPGPVGAGPAVPGEKGGAAKASFRDDDDINDVAAMGGVNLQEESQRILGTGAEIIGQQIRSCKDEPFLHGTPLHSRISGIVRKHELTDCSADVIALVSHAVQERLKTLVEKLGCIAEHRQEQFKNNPNYVVYQDVKAQVQFLQELDRIEKKRHEEQEREVLIKAAKSRSKMDDPDHIAIKARAKEMQRQEMEEIRQREANETALQAIGFPKKRQKTGPATSGGGTNSSGGPSSVGGGGSGGGTDGPFGTGGGGGGSLNNLSGGSNSNGLGLGSSSSSGLTNHSGGGGGGLGGSGGGNGAGSGSSTKPAIKRIKRVTMKDVYFMMEHEHDIVRSHSLYRTYAR